MICDANHPPSSQEGPGEVPTQKSFYMEASAVHVPFSEASAVFYDLYCVRRWCQEKLKHKICEMRLMFWVAALKILRNLWENLSNQFFLPFFQALVAFFLSNELGNTQNEEPNKKRPPPTPPERRGAD